MYKSCICTYRSRVSDVLISQLHPSNDISHIESDLELEQLHTAGNLINSPPPAYRPFREIWGPRAKINLGAPSHLDILHSHFYLLYSTYVQNNFTKFLPVHLILTSYKNALRAHLDTNDSKTSSQLIFLAMSRSHDSMIRLDKRSCPIVQLRQFLTIPSVLKDLSRDKTDTGMLTNNRRATQT